MPPRRQAEEGLLGVPDSVLGPNWLEAYFSVATYDHLIAWVSPQLPTKKQILLLYFFLRHNNNPNLEKTKLVTMVEKEVKKLWNMAGVRTATKKNMKKQILALLSDYQAVMKDSQVERATGTAELRRQVWVEDSLKLFDCASPLAEEELRRNRLLENEDKQEDLAFLYDQRSLRLQFIGQKDKVFAGKVEDKENRKENDSKNEDNEKKRVNLEKKQEQEQRRAATKREHEDTQQNTAEEDDDNYEVQEGKKTKKRGEKVTIELPKDPFKDPFVSATLDRHKISSRQALGFFGALVKTGEVEGEKTDLNKFVVSASQINKHRNFNRELNATLAMDHFKRTRPKHAGLHWDGKLLFDHLGQGWEAESILVSGPPEWEEGKLLDVANLQGEDGGPSSTGEIQFTAVKKSVLIWDIRDHIRALVFDTSASNTGVHRGCCSRLARWLGRPVLLPAPDPAPTDPAPTPAPAPAPDPVPAPAPASVLTNNPFSRCSGVGAGTT